MEGAGFAWSKAIVALAALAAAYAISVLPPPEGLDQKAMTMVGVTFVAIVFWATECVPIPVTGLVVMLLLTLYGVFPLARSISFVASKVNVLVLAGLAIAAGLSAHRLDRFIGLKIASLVGDRADMLMLGVMLATMALSMWIPNTAAAALMAPVAAGILRLSGAERGRSSFGKAVMIGVAYAATIGGVGTPVGTPPVPIAIDNVERVSGTRIGFAAWMAWGVPVALALTLAAWRLLLLLYPPERRVVAGGSERVRRELEALGRMSGVQRRALALFLLVALLWLLDPLVSSVFRGSPWAADWTYVVSILAVILFTAPVLGVLSWRELSREVDWGVLLLVAGGLALGEGLRETGVIPYLSRVVAARLSGANPYAALTVLAAITALSTTVFCSITATASAMVPVVLGIASALGLDPRVAGVVAGVASALAFVLPASTPPNAVAYSFGYFKNYEMAKAGLLLIPLAVALAVLVCAPMVPALV